MAADPRVPRTTRGASGSDGTLRGEEPEGVFQPPAGLGSRSLPASSGLGVLPRVCAVLVCRDGGAYLRRTLEAVRAQSRAADQLILVDAGASPRPELAGAGAFPVLRVASSASFGDAVTAALVRQDAGTTVARAAPRPDTDAATEPGAVAVPDEVVTLPDEPVVLPDEPAVLPDEPLAVPDEPAVLPDAQDPGEDVVTARGAEWLWLLHDDSAPAADALAWLLAAVQAAPSVGVAGCKQVRWENPNLLLDVGFTTTRFGARVTGVEPREVDQGQHDERCDVLAVSTAGMLIRRELWQELGGPDPGLAQARDDLDLCRRARLAGHRVIVVPEAVVAHARASSRGVRGRSARFWRWADRRDAVHLRLAAVHPLLLPLAVVATLLAVPFRAAARLVLKQPERAVDECTAVVAAVARVPVWVRARRRAGRSRRVPPGTLRTLETGSRQAWRARRDVFVTRLQVNAQSRSGPGAPGGTPLTIHRPVGMRVARSLARRNEAAWSRRSRRLGRWAGVAVAGLLVAANVAALWSVVRGTGALVGPALAPLPGHASTLWSRALSSWRPVGLGAAAPADPLVALIALIAAPLGGDPSRAALVLELGALPLSGLTAWWAAGRVVPSRLVRLWAALAWAAAPPLLQAVATGRIGAVTAHLLLPLFAVSLARVVGLAPLGRPDRFGAVTTSSLAGLLLTAILAGAPSLAVPLALVVILAVLAGRRDRWLLSWTVVVPLALLAPWWRAVTERPWLLFADATGSGASSGSSVGSGRTSAPVALGRHLLLSPGDPGKVLGVHSVSGRWVLDHLPFGAAHGGTVLTTLCLVAVLPVGVAGVLALTGRRWRAALALWVVFGAGLATAGLAERARLGAGTARPITGWSGPALSVALLGLLAAGALGVDAGVRRSRRLPARGVLLGALALVLAIGPVLVGAVWSGGLAGVRGSTALTVVHRSARPVLPEVAALEAEGPAAMRTLVLREESAGLAWALARSGAAGFGDGSAALSAREAGTSVSGGTTSPGGTTSGATGASRAGLVPDARLIVPVLARLISDSDQDARPGLVDLDIGSVLMEPPIDDQLAQALDASPGLARVAAVHGAILWRVELGDAATSGVDGSGPTRPARARVLAADGTVLAGLPSSGADLDTWLAPGDPGRILVLSERADPGWQAELDGVALHPVRHAGWDQAFALPTRGGHLRVVHRSRWQDMVTLGRGVVAALALLVAVPVPQIRRRLSAPARSSRPVPRGPAERLGTPTPLPIALGRVPGEGEPPGTGSTGPDPRPDRDEDARSDGATALARGPGSSEGSASPGGPPAPESTSPTADTGAVGAALDSLGLAPGSASEEAGRNSRRPALRRPRRGDRR